MNEHIDDLYQKTINESKAETKGTDSQSKNSKLGKKRKRLTKNKKESDEEYRSSEDDDNKSVNSFMNDDSNYENFEKEKLKNYTFNELEEIVFKEFKIYGDLDDLEADINKGFEFVTKKFLDSLEVEFNDEDYKVKYMQDSNNIIIKFKDDSKLIIFTDKNNQKKYHAIPAPVISAQDKSQFIRTSTICISRRKKGNTVLVQRKSNAI